MALTRNVIFIAFVLLVLVSITTQKKNPWWQCDTVTVVKDVKKAWNPDSQNITVTTNSEAGSGEWVDVYFFDTAGILAGAVFINFGTEIMYYLGECSSSFTPFPTALLPAVTEKTWTITYNYMERLVLHCNGVQVADVVLSECDFSYWKKYWENKPTQMQFGMFGSDTASDTYCFSSNPGKYNGVIDSGE